MGPMLLFFSINIKIPKAKSVKRISPPGNIGVVDPSVKPFVSTFASLPSKMKAQL